MEETKEDLIAELKAVKKQESLWKEANHYLLSTLKRQMCVWKQTAEEIEKRIAELEEIDINMTTKQNCGCITKSRYKECLDDFNCEKCGMCMNWRGYEEGTINCGCRFKGLEEIDNIR